MRIIILFTEISTVKDLVAAGIQVAGKEGGAILGLFLKRKNQKPFLQSFSMKQRQGSEDLPLIVEMIDWAAETCKNAGISFNAVYEKEISLPQLINQATYSDLVIADARTDFNDYLLTTLNVSLKDMLVDAHCPVLLVRPVKEPLSKIIFTYDGSYSSMHAIKMFSYLFPSREIPVLLISVNSNRDDQAGNEKFLQEWLLHHYSNIEKEVLQLNAKEQLLELVNKFTGNVYVVISAYGKEAYARIFHPSHVNLLQKFSKASLFISHE